MIVIFKHQFFLLQNKIYLIRIMLETKLHSLYASLVFSFFLNNWIFDKILTGDIAQYLDK